jgi:uncharacterized protein involved in type VI secretion and phage assembly
MNNGRMAGVLVGIVRDLDDPLGLGRVRVAFPTLGNQLSDWARIVTFMAGNDRGALFRPEPDDEVAVVFESDHPERPLVLGGMWSQTDRPPPDDGQARDNNWRTIVSRSGTTLRFDDTRGAEKVELIDKDGKRRVVLDSKAKKVRVEADEGAVEVKAPKGEVTVEAKTITLKATDTISIEATGTVKVKGSSIELN